VIEAIGAALILTACAGIGFQMARLYRQRPQHLNMLHHAVRVLQAEIEYSVTPLGQALERVGTRTPAPISLLFQAAADALTNQDVSVSEAFEQGILRARGQCALKSHDYEIVREFANTLGRADRVHQSQEIVVTLSRIESARRDAVEAQRKNERLCQYLGVLTGLTVVIVLYR
jgi:stage III sporulation protein AB